MKKGFTLLELLLVIILIMIVFSVFGAVFTNNIKSFLFFSKDLTADTQKLSFITQISQQLFSKYENKSENIKIDEDRISFYTYSPIFYEGIVRAEYIIKRLPEGNVKIIYEEFPFADGNLGFDGLKKSFIGRFEDFEILVYENGLWKLNYKDKKFPQIIKIRINKDNFYITTNARVVR